MQIYGLWTKVRWLLKTVGYQWLLYVYYAQTYIHIGIKINDVFASRLNVYYKQILLRCYTSDNTCMATLFILSIRFLLNVESIFGLIYVKSFKHTLG